MQLGSQILKRIYELHRDKAIDDWTARLLTDCLQDLHLELWLTDREADGVIPGLSYKIEAYLSSKTGLLDEVSAAVTLESMVDETLEANSGSNGLDADSVPMLLSLAADLEKQAANIRAICSTVKA